MNRKGDIPIRTKGSGEIGKRTGEGVPIRPLCKKEEEVYWIGAEPRTKRKECQDRFNRP